MYICMCVCMYGVGGKIPEKVNGEEGGGKWLGTLARRDVDVIKRCIK